MINAVQRSGTIEEKELLFKSMLKHEAFQMIDSNKRGHKLGEQERLVDQAVRMSTNVKNRQTREQDKMMEELESLMLDLGLLDHKVILFTLDEGELNRNIAGLIANKIANKYQRPCCILTHTIKKIQHTYNEPELKGIVVDEYILEFLSLLALVIGNAPSAGT